jgi:hypothetical protein
LDSGTPFRILYFIVTSRFYSISTFYHIFCVGEFTLVADKTATRIYW